MQPGLEVNGRMETGSNDFSARLAGVAQETDALLGQLLADAPLEGEIARPPRLKIAIAFEYGSSSTLRGLKRCPIAGRWWPWTR